MLVATGNIGRAVDVAAGGCVGKRALVARGVSADATVATSAVVVLGGAPSGGDTHPVDSEQ